MKIEILTPKKPGKQNSIFYAGYNIATVKHGNRTYTLTTSGYYQFTCRGKRYEGDSVTGAGQVKYPKTLTDQKIKSLDYGGEINNWGWFGINAWVGEQCLNDHTGVYGTYDEALRAFRKFVKEDTARHSIPTARKPLMVYAIHSKCCNRHWELVFLSNGKVDLRCEKCGQPVGPSITIQPSVDFIKMLREEGCHKCGNKEIKHG